MRINKRLTELGVCSRRQADKLIEENRITVNGQPVTLGQQIEETDSIEIDGQPVAADHEKPVLLAYYKPRGIVCTTTDNDRAENIVEAVNYPVRVYPVGRLDKDSEGLILLTNQGDLVNRINRARYHHEKEYVVTVDKLVTKAFLDKLAAGVYIKELDETTRPCKVWQESGISTNRRMHEFHIVITQGLNRQIRRMCEALGFQVKRLKRVRIMELRLGTLRPGEYREITEDALGLPKANAGSLHTENDEYKHKG